MSDSHDIVRRADMVPATAILHPAVERMLAASPTPETLREILALQREHERDQAKRAYIRALVEMRHDLPAWIKRDKVVDYPSAKGKVHYTHTSLAAALEAIMPALTAHGFSLSWIPASAPNGQVTVTATLTHRDGHSEAATLAAPPDASGNKSSAQAVASTVTLLQRYTALSLLGIATSDTDEPNGNGGNGGSHVPAEGGKVDSVRNMKAMEALSKCGKTREQAEAHVGKPIQDWDQNDLAKLKAWIVPPATPPPPTSPSIETSEKPQSEPGADVGEDNSNALLPTDGDTTPISEQQRKWLFSVLTKTGKKHEQLKEYLASQYGIASTKDIPQMLFAEILSWAETK